MQIDQLLSFAFASVLCIIAPGPDNIMVLSTGISKGHRAGMGFAVGCGLGCIIHAILAAVGISALIMASASAFQVVKFIGAGYLFYLAFLAFKSGSLQIKKTSMDGGNLPIKNYLIKGFFANALNPKVALFFLAFLPQFVDSQGSIAQQMLLLGILFGVLTVIIFASLGYFSGGIGSWLNRKPATAKWLDRLTGVVFVVLGLRLITATQK